MQHQQNVLGQSRNGSSRALGSAYSSTNNSAMPSQQVPNSEHLQKFDHAVSQFTTSPSVLSQSTPNSHSYQAGLQAQALQSYTNTNTSTKTSSPQDGRGPYNSPVPKNSQSNKLSVRGGNSGSDDIRAYRNKTNSDGNDLRSQTQGGTSYIVVNNNESSPDLHRHRTETDQALAEFEIARSQGLGNEESEIRPSSEQSTLSTKEWLDEIVLKSIASKICTLIEGEGAMPSITRDQDGYLISFETKEQAVLFSDRIHDFWGIESVIGSIGSTAIEGAGYSAYLTENAFALLRSEFYPDALKEVASFPTDRLDKLEAHFQGKDYGYVRSDKEKAEIRLLKQDYLETLEEALKDSGLSERKTLHENAKNSKLMGIGNALFSTRVQNLLAKYPYPTDDDSCRVS